MRYYYTKKEQMICRVVLGVIIASALFLGGCQLGWKLGYDNGWNKGSDDVEHAMVVNGIIEPRTDSEIWEKYHDCDMYGLPDYARQECGR